jgi:hypothetical protein
MLALLASYFLIFFFLVPSRIFQISAFFLKLKKFQRTRTEEITFAFLVAIVPFCLAGLGSFFLEAHGLLLVSWPHYQEIFEAAYSEELFRKSLPQFWSSLSEVVVAQGLFLSVFYPFCFVELVIFIVLVKKWGDWRERHRYYRWFAEKLIRNISEWDMLLTSFNFPRAENRIVVSDVLTVEDHLYQGIVKEYYLNTEGELTGIFLKSPYRFNREDYNAKKKVDASTKSKDFWVRVPGENLYVPKDKILNLNVWYPPEGAVKLPGSATADTESAAATMQLTEEGLPYTVVPADEDNPEEPK